MKTTLRTILCATLLTAYAQANAVPTIIADDYVGSDSHGYGDVIGNTSNFQINNMSVELIGTKLSVTISTSFAGKGDNGLFSGYTYDGKGIGYGDLFLSSSWNPYGSAPYSSDNASNGTNWEYGFSLDNRYMNETLSGLGTLYSLNSGDNSDILLSEDFVKNATFRNGQEVAVDTANGNITAIATSVNSWNIDANNGTVNFLIDLNNTNLLASNQIALRWEFTCANDVIEGAFDNVHAAEPAVLPLMSVGLLALLGIKRRKRHS
jgi:hypothetical protein